MTAGFSDPTQKLRIFRIALSIGPSTLCIHACTAADCIHVCRVRPMIVVDHATSHGNALTLAIYGNCRIYNIIIESWDFVVNHAVTVYC